MASLLFCVILPIDLEDDAARANWGGQWVMPSKEEVKELFNNTTNESATLNGVNGWKFTSKANGNSIFLPAAGYRIGSELDSQGKSGHYWSATLDPQFSNMAWHFFFDPSTASYYTHYRYRGESVRPVLRK